MNYSDAKAGIMKQDIIMFIAQLLKHKPILSLTIVLLWCLFGTSAIAQTDTPTDRVYIKIEIKGMACPYCAFGMEKELKQVAGVESVEIELKKGLAYISTPANQKPSKEDLEGIVVDGGFTVGEIEFSDKPFSIKKE